MTTATRRLAPALGLLLALGLGLTGCGGEEKKAGGGDPQAVLTEAKNKFDDASSVHFTMETKSKPSKGDAVLGAEGTLTHQPAFEGKVKAHVLGVDADIPIVAVDGKVYAKLPFSGGYASIDPAEYGAPDPADFADPDTGISGLLLELADVKEGDKARKGKLVLTTYTGTLTGDLVKPIIPSADSDGSYATVIGIDEDGRIATLKVTGAFFEDGGDVTYDLVFDDYGKDVTVKKP